MWTPRDVEYALCEAVVTLRRVKVRDYLLNYKAKNGLDIILDERDLFALGISRAEILEGPDKPKLILHPQQEALDRYMEVLDWLRFLPMDFRELRKLVNAAIDDQGEMPTPQIRWKIVQKELTSKVDRRVLRKRYNDAVTLIAKRLNEKKTPTHSSIYLLLQKAG